MIFDDLHDPDPPRPGMREFAIVAERARAIRQRRARHAVRWACAVALLAGGAVVALLASGDGRGPTTPVATVPSSNLEIDPSITLLRDAGHITGLAPVTLSAPVRLTWEPITVELSETDDRRVCARVVGDLADPACAEPGAGLVAIELAGTGGTTPTLVVAVDPQVDITFLTVGVTCRRPLPDQGAASELPLDVWLCDGLRLDRASVDVRSAGLVVIASLPER